MGTGPSKEEQLYQSAQLGNHQLVRSLHRDGASLEWVDKEGRTPLLFACTCANRFDMVTTLLNLGANINAYRPGAHGGFPLHHAAKKGLDKTVILLLTRGADPLLINDDGQTPLDMARVRGHLSVVRLIEDCICLFSGALREIYGPGFLEVLAPQWAMKKIWAVVLPTKSRMRRRRPRYKLFIYSSSKAAQPRTVISLAKAAVDEPRFSAPDPVLIITDRSKKQKFKLLSGIEGDKLQLERLYTACRGIHQLDADLPTESTLQGVPAVAMQSPPPPVLVNTDQGSEVIPEDVAFAMGLNASLQPASSTQGSLEANDYKNWVNAPEGLADELDSTHNGCGSSEAGPSTSLSSTNTHSIAPAGSISAPEAELASEVSSYNITAPSAPPLPSEFAASVTEFSLVHYPSVDTSPFELNYGPTNLTQHPAAAKENAHEKAGSVCVVCLDSPAEAACIPCGHLAGCMECLLEIKSKNCGCPICRAKIDQVVKVYKV